jgi:hypothetical protein
LTVPSALETAVNAKEARPLRQEAGHRVQVQGAVVLQRHVPHLGARGGAGQVPGHQVGVVLHARDEDLVPGLQPRPQEAVRHQVDALGGAAGEDDLALAPGVQEPLHGDARALVSRRGPLAQRVDGAVDVGVVVRVEARHRVDDDLGLLRGGAVVQVGQGFAAHALREHGELRTQGGGVEVPAHDRSPPRARSSQSPRWSRTVGMLTASTISAAKAPVSTRRAWSASSPRERR